MLHRGPLARRAYEKDGDCVDDHKTHDCEDGDTVALHWRHPKVKAEDAQFQGTIAC